MHIYTLRWNSWHKEAFQATNQKETSLYVPTEHPLLFLMTFKHIFPTYYPYITPYITPTIIVKYLILITLMWHK